MTIDSALRDEIRQLVADVVPFDGVEVDAQASVLAWIDSGAELFREHGATPPRHLAVYFAFLDDADGSVMQVDHVKAKAWLLPGGHNDRESPWMSVVRECKEELGVDAAFHGVTGRMPLFLTESQTRGPDSHTDVTLWFVLSGSRDMAVHPDEREFTGIRWVRLADVEKWVGDCYAPQQVARFVAKLTAALERASVTV